MRPISDEDWFGMRAAARSSNWAELERRARNVGFLLVAKHAQRAAFERRSRAAIRFALLLDRPDEADPFWDEHGRARGRGDVNAELGERR